MHDLLAKLDPWRLTIRRDDARLKDLSELDFRQLRAAQLGAVVSLTPTMLIANAVNLAILLLAFRRSDHDVFLSLWGASFCLILALWFFRWRTDERAPARTETSWRGARRLTINGLVLGSLWATPIVYLFRSATQPEAIILACLAAGLTSGGALAMATVWQAALAFTLALMIPALADLVFIGGAIYGWLAALTVSFTFVVARTVSKHADLFIDSHFASAQIRHQSQIIGLLLKDFEEGASDFLWETDSRGRLTRVSARLATLIGQSEDVLEGLAFADLLGRLDADTPIPARDFAARLTARAPFRDHHVGLTIAGRRRLWSMTGKPVMDARGQFQGFRGVGSDVTDSDRLANYDPLTGLPNRALFAREAAKAITRLNQERRSFAVMTIDLDRFKRVNDTLGHGVGDALLAAAATRIRVCLGDNGLATRFGGDEFVILHEDGDMARTRALCQRLIAELSRAFEIEDFRISVGASLGVALAPDDGDAFEALLRKSDLALYRAKSDGRGHFCFFAAGLDEVRQARRQWELDLRAAQSAGQLSLHYQPLIDTRTGAITSCEALIRWTHPSRGEVAPAEFLPLAEETGLMAALDEWVLEAACSEAVLWPRNMRVAVNVSPIRFRMGDIDQTIARALANSGLPPDRLEIEITESLFAENFSETRAMLKAIRDLGVRVSLDYFGAGSSSLSYLFGFAFDKIKIDKRFVRDLDAGANGAEIARAVAALAEALGVRMTAEGVETDEQLARLADFGFHEAQGFLFSRPLSARDIGDLLGGAARETPSPASRENAARSAG